MGYIGKYRHQRVTNARGRIGPFSLISPVDGASLVLGRIPPSGGARSQGFTDEAKARARARRLGDGWEAWRAPDSSPTWFVRRLPRPAYNPTTADATYTVLGATDEVLARYVTADAVPALVRRAKGNASVFDDRDGNCVIAGTDGAPATLAAVEILLEKYETTYVVSPDVVGYFTDSNYPGAVLTLAQLDYAPAKNYLDPRDQRAIEALAPGESHQPLPGDTDKGPFYGIVTRLSAATQAKAIVRGGVVLGVGFDEAQARANATERSPADAQAVDVEVVDATLAALSGWPDDALRDRVYLAPDGRVRRIDVFDVLPHDEGTPNDPRWATDEGAGPDDEEEPAPAASAPDPGWRSATYVFTTAATIDRFTTEARARGWRVEGAGEYGFGSCSWRGVCEEHVLTVWAPDIAEARALALATDSFAAHQVDTFSFSTTATRDRFIEEAGRRDWFVEPLGLLDECGESEEYLVSVWAPDIGEARALASAIEPA